jgi:hypothetical protein
VAVLVSTSFAASRNRRPMLPEFLKCGAWC